MTPSPESDGALRAVSDTLPAPPPTPRKPSVLQRPAVQAGGLLGSVVVILSLMVPVWQTWLERGQQTDRLEARIEGLESSNRQLRREVKALRAENVALRKQLLGKRSP